MPVARTELERQLLAALRRIANYMTVEAMERDAKNIGLSPHEYVEMAYENVIGEAKRATRGVRLPAKQGAE